jgi:glycosyltransferase involved in cell wall biosynthesis
MREVFRNLALDRPHRALAEMRILELTYSLDIGGAERMVSSLALNMAAEGHSVHVVCLHYKGPMHVPEARFRRAGVALVEMLKTDGFSPKTLRRLASYMREHQIDIVHTHNPVVHHYGVLAARMAGVPVVVNTIHGISTLSMQKWAKLLFISSCLACDRIVHVTQAVKEAFLKTRVAAKHSTVIPNGIELEDLLAVQPRRREGHFVFGTIGRLAPVKDQASLLKAFSVVQREFPESRLEILGTGELEGQLGEQASELGISRKVCFHGWNPDIASFLSRLDVFVLSSRSEGLPLTLLESMAAGLPVVATAVGGIPEVVNRAQCGWLCRPEDPAALASMMKAALQSKDLHDKGCRARRDVMAYHSAEKMTSDYLRLFSDLLESCGRKRK